MCLCLHQKPANILVMGEGPERGRVKIGMYSVSFLKLICCLVYLSVHWHTYPLCSGHGVCSSLQFTAEAFSRSRPCGGHLLVQSTWTAPGSSALHQSHRWDSAAPSVFLSSLCVHVQPVELKLVRAYRHLGDWLHFCGAADVWAHIPLSPGGYQDQ